MPDLTTAASPQLPVQNLQWEDYLSQLDLNNPALAQYLRSVLGALPNSVPVAGQYTTSPDYATLHAALTSQYVSEVIQKYEAQLGPAPELYQAAQAAGYLTAEQVQALQSPGFTKVGTLQQQFASQGGLRTLAGPYQAARTQLLEQALADMQAASQKAASDAYTLAQQTTGLRVQALGEAGRQGVQLVGAGVSRQNAKTAAEAAGEQPPFDFPRPPTPERPPWWEQMLPALATAGVAGLTRWLTQPREKTPEDLARERDRYLTETEKLQQDRTALRTAEERPPGWGEDQSPAMSSAFAPTPPSMGPYDFPEMTPPPMQNPYGGIPTGPNVGANGWPTPPSYSWQAQMPDYSYSNPSYSGPPDTSWQNQYPSYNYPQQYGTDTYGYYDPSAYDYSYDYPSYDYGYTYDPYTYSGDTSSGYWV